MSNRYFRIRSWEEFKRLTVASKPDAVVYSIDQNGLSKTKDLTCLRLILPEKSGYYVYLDFPKGGKLRETGIPIREDELGNHYLHDEDIVKFLRNTFDWESLEVFSFWTA